MTLVDLANPSRFLRAANLAIPWLGGATMLLFEQSPNGPCPHAHAHARAREIIEEFRLGSIALPARPTVSRARRVIMSLMPTSGLVWLGRHRAA